MSGVANPEISSVENQYLGRMRELDNFVRENHELQVIDQDFAPEHTKLPSSPDSLQQFDKEFEKLQGQIEDSERAGEMMSRNVGAARMVIGVLAGEIVIGKNISHESFVEGTMGLRPEKVPKKELRRQKEEVAEMVGRLGYAYSEDDREAFNEEYSLGQGEIEESIEGLSEVMQEDVTRAFGRTTLKDLEIPGIEPVKSEQTWQGYFGYDREKGFFINVNTNPLLQISLIEERALLAHEGGHWASSALKQRGIARGDISPARGILPLFSPDYTKDEVIARAVESYIFKDWGGDFARYMFKKFKYENDVVNNMIIQANSGASRAEVSIDARMMLPFQKPDKIRQDAKDFADNLLFKTVFAIDAHALRMGNSIASLPEEERKSQLIKLTTGSEDIKDLSAELK